MSKYDVAIIGGGIGGLMAAYRLIVNNKELKIIVIEKGKNLQDRKCPASNGNKCIHCNVCSITSGFAGSGAFSDGKYNLGTSYGGTLGEELGEELAMRYINEVDKILYKFTSSNIKMYGTDENLKIKCLQNDLRLLDMNVKHYGTDNNFEIMSGLILFLNAINVKLVANEEIKYIEKLEKDFILAGKNNNYVANKVIIATGRNGANFVKDVCTNFNIPVISNAVDIGVRVEMDDCIWKEFSSRIYEPKIIYKTKTFEDKTRMFCFNQGGIVSSENNDGIISVNGHAFADANRKTKNCNFAILSSIHFTQPFNNPTEYAKSISKLANIIGDGNVIVQRFGDLISGRRTNEHRLKQNSIIPTLNATAGDLSLVLPHRILTNIIETLYALDKVAPGSANRDTLLYGVESKYYSMKPEHNKDFQIYPNIYLIGDGSGICRGLSQSGAMGLYVADNILNKL